MHPEYTRMQHSLVALNLKPRAFSDCMQMACMQSASVAAVQLLLLVSGALQRLQASSQDSVPATSSRLSKLGGFFGILTCLPRSRTQSSKLELSRLLELCRAASRSF